MVGRIRDARLALLAGLLPILALRTATCSAESPFATKAVSLLRTFCHDCHGPETAEANLDVVQLTAAADVGTDFRRWEKIVGMLRQRKMPPELAAQPNDRQRTAIVDAIQTALDEYIAKNAGDPGPIIMRRLTSAEYGYTIRDLTGLDLDLERTFNNDAVGGEGFTNVGRAQFMQESSLERYLEAARTVAAHAVIGAGPLDFFADPGQTGLELSAIERIQRIYRQHGFRSGAGEGAEPFGLEQYPKAFLVAWRYRHRKALGMPQASLAEFAKAERLSVHFAEHLWKTLNRPEPSFPLSVIIERWRALAPAQASADEVRDGCEALYRAMRKWQSVLAAATGDEEEAAVLSGTAVHVRPTHRFEADIDWPPGARTAAIELSTMSATNGEMSRSIVVWKNARVRFQDDDKRWHPLQPLRSCLTETSLRTLRRTTDESTRRKQVPPSRESDTFALTVPMKVALELVVPESMWRGELIVEVALDTARGGAPVRVTISDGLVEGETIAEAGGHSAILADPDWPSYAAWERGVLRFARALPEVSHREPAPSDRDPIPAPFDNAYNQPERDWFHTHVKYHRDDEFLVQHVLDDATRRRLDQAWTDLLASFEYHDANLQFIEKKYGLDRAPPGGWSGRDIAALDRQTIDALPEQPRRFIRRLHESYLAGRKRLRAAEPGHVDEALRFAERAWRRPLTEDEQKRLRTFYDGLRNDAGLDHTPAMRALLTRILVSPVFLYRAEPADTADTTAAPRGTVPLSDWELANRLSYFLDSSIPDEPLRRAAATGRLTNDPDELARQARRMLRDPKARRFATEFFGQWFGFYRFDDYRGIDAERFPEFTEALKASLYDEACSFFEHIVRADRPVREILFADYAFWNHELARHYGADARIEPETPATASGTPTLVEHVDRHHRGGLLRLGAVLAVTSAPRRTSPVRRGDWILRRVLGTPVPPPPPDAGSLPDPARSGSSPRKPAKRLTIREQLQAHRREASCVNCHSRIDPLGFALEHYDAIGRWRDRYDAGQPIDSAGVLNDGTRIDGPDGLRRYLEAHERRFHRTLCTKLLGYALGRAEIASDRPLIENMMADLANDGRLSQLVTRIVTSPQFRYRRVGEY